MNVPHAIAEIGTANLKEELRQRRRAEHAAAILADIRHFCPQAVNVTFAVMRNTSIGDVHFIDEHGKVLLQTDDIEERALDTGWILKGRWNEKTLLKFTDSRLWEFSTEKLNGVATRQPLRLFVAVHPAP